MPQMNPADLAEKLKKASREIRSTQVAGTAIRVTFRDGVGTDKAYGILTSLGRENEWFWSRQVSSAEIDFDADGRLWVLEMLTFLPDTSGRDSKEPLNRVSVLEDTDGDGKMDKKTVFADKLAMPRALKVLEHGVLVGEPPNLWLMKDTDGDLKALASTMQAAGSTGIESSNM